MRLVAREVGNHMPAVGGRAGGRGFWKPSEELLEGFWRRGGARTPSNSSPSSLWRGMTLTSSISQRKAVSAGVSPGGRGNAMFMTRDYVIANSWDARATNGGRAPRMSLTNLALAP